VNGLGVGSRRAAGSGVQDSRGAPEKKFEFAGCGARDGLFLFVKFLCSHKRAVESVWFTVVEIHGLRMLLRVALHHQ